MAGLNKQGYSVGDWSRAEGHLISAMKNQFNSCEDAEARARVIRLCEEIVENERRYKRRP